MDPIEPIRLDMNLFNMAMMQRQHQAGLEETQRHHGILEAQGAVHNDALSQKVQADALTNVMNNPDIDPIARQRAASTLYGFASKNQGPQLDPGDYLKYEPLWRNFLSANAKNPQSQEAADAMQQLSSVSPFSKDRIKEAQARQQQVQTAQGMSELPTLAGQQPFSPAISSAIQSSHQLQEQAGKAFLNPLEAARAKQIDQQTQDLKSRETLALGDFKAYNTAVTPVFDIPTEEAHIANLDKQPKMGGPLTSDQSKRSQIDKSARMYGALTSEQREQAKATIPQVMDTLNQQATDLQQQLHNAKHDLEGTSGNPDTIKSQLDATRLAVGIKGKELAYLENPTTANRLAVKNAYGDYQKLLDQKKAEVLRLRQASNNTAQSALNQMKYQDTLDYQNKLIPAQAEFSGSDLTPKAAGAIAAKHGVLTEDVLKGGKNPQQPLVDIKLSEGLAKEVGPMMSDSRNAAIGSIDTIDTVSRARAAIESGLVSVGPTATIRQKIGQVAQMLGVGGKDNEEQIVNTRNVIRSLGQFSLAARKSLKGQGQVSDFEGKLLIKAESGDIEDMTIPELKSFLSVTDRLAHRQYDLHQQNLKTMKANPKLSELAPFYEVPEVPKTGSSPAAPPQKPASGAPRVGQMDGGYIYKGGDPSKKESWEKAK